MKVCIIANEIKADIQRKVLIFDAMHVFMFYLFKKAVFIGLVEWLLGEAGKLEEVYTDF